jgi:hypothetical protein
MGWGQAEHDGQAEPESTLRNLARSEQVEDRGEQMDKMGQAEQTTTQADQALHVRPGGHATIMVRGPPLNK